MANLQQKFQSVGFFGIFKEAFKTVFRAKKIFTLITLATIFPLSLTMFSHLYLLQFLIYKIDFNQNNLSQTHSGSAAHKRVVYRLVFLWILFTIYNAAYLFLVFFLYLVSTSSVMYTVVSNYAGKVLTFRELLSVVPKVSERCMICPAWLMLIHQIMILMFLNYMCFGNFHLVKDERGVTIVLDAILLIIAGSLFFLGFMNLEWHLACVSSIFDTRFITLIKAKWSLAKHTVAIIQLIVITTLGSFYLLVVLGNLTGIISTVSCWIISTLLLSTTILLGFVIQTLIYFVCKACLGESIDEAFLEARLNAFLAGRNNAHELNDDTVV